jgi:hypothetical protein
MYFILKYRDEIGIVITVEHKTVAAVLNDVKELLLVKFAYLDW